MNERAHFSSIDADRILRRAAEIEGSGDTGRVTADELRLIAGEAGFRSAAVERAIAEAQAATVASPRHPPVQKWGLVITRMSALREIPLDVSSDQLMRVVRLMQPYREGPAHVKLEEREITWRDRKGLQFAVTSSGGVTEIRVYLSKFLVRKGRWMGWVKAAADRLETLLYLVANQDAGSAARRARITPPTPQTAEQPGP